MTLRSGLRLLLGLAVGVVGALHFVNPAPFVAIVPSALPSPLALVWVSGACELGLALGLLFPRPRVQVLAAWGMAALFVAVFPANINMAIHDIKAFGEQVPAWVAWARLPLQLVLLAWALWLTRQPQPEATATGR